MHREEILIPSHHIKSTALIAHFRFESKATPCLDKAGQSLHRCKASYQFVYYAANEVNNDGNKNSTLCSSIRY